MRTGCRIRVEERIAAWRVEVERVAETPTSVLAFGYRDGEPVVLKVIKNPGSEWRAGRVLDAFDGRGMVRVLDHVDGAMLLERLSPGQPLSQLVIESDDDEATEIWARLVGDMAPRPVEGSLTPADRGWSYAHYVASANARIPKDLVQAAQRAYEALCSSQVQTRLLHGDLHHDNVLLDADRGWLAIDPKGILAEIEYEVGAFLRNPYERPDVFADPSTLRRRVERLSSRLELNVHRVLAWTFAQSVLGAIWVLEDGDTVGPEHGWIRLAHVLRPMIEEEYAK